MERNKKPIPQRNNAKGITFLNEQIEDTYLPMLHGKATDAIAGMSSRGASVNPITGSLTIEKRETKLVIDKFNELAATLGINAHKLLSAGIVEFTALNDVSGKPAENLNCGATIPLESYASQCGYDVIPHYSPDATEEEIALEEKRANNALKDARKKIKKDLQLLSSSRISWREKVKGKNEDYVDIAIIGTNGIRNGNIYMVFDPVFSRYLAALPLTQYPKALFSLDARSGNAYKIGLKMAEHYNLDNNQKIGTAQLLKVKNLLKETELPTIATIRKQRASWEARIKEPFEIALEALIKCGLLEDWRYSKSKGVELTDEEATSFTNYEEWIETLVHFTLKDAPDHTQRLERRAEEQKKQRKNKKKKAK